MVWFLGGPVQSHELELMILVGPFHLGIFYNCVFLFLVMVQENIPDLKLFTSYVFDFNKPLYILYK